MFKFFHKIDTVTGICEECQEHTILVAIVSEFYRCINCGADMEQHINGAINYIPTLSPSTLKSKLDKYFGDGKG